MATRSLDILIRARDEATAILNKTGAGVQQLSGNLDALKSVGRTLLGALGIGSAVYGLVSFFRSSSEAFFEQEKASRGLSDALSMLGVNAARAMPEMEAFASGIQSVTTMSDEAVLQMMSMGAALGRLSGDALQKATVAAIGLAKRLSIDTETAMRLVSKAAQGSTTTLKKYGIVLEASLSPQEKFNELLRLGAEAFRMAQGEAETAAGKIDQLKNRWDDFKEMMGQGWWTEGPGAWFSAFADWAAPDTVKSIVQARMEIEKQGDTWNRLFEAVGRVQALKQAGSWGVGGQVSEGDRTVAAQRLEAALQAVNEQVTDFNYIATDIAQGGLLGWILESTGATQAYANTLDDLRKKADELRKGQQEAAGGVRLKLVGEIGESTRKLEILKGETTEAEQQVRLWAEQYNLTTQEVAVLKTMVETAAKLREEIAGFGKAVLPWQPEGEAGILEAMRSARDQEEQSRKEDADWLAGLREKTEAPAAVQRGRLPAYIAQGIMRAPGQDPLVSAAQRAEKQRNEQTRAMQQVADATKRMADSPVPWTNAALAN